MQMKNLLFAAVVGFPLLSGCATVVRGTEQSLQITSIPPGAKATLGTGQSCITPCALELSQSTSTVVTFEQDGCERTRISVFPTLAAAGVVLRGVIDYGTGAVYNLQPNPVVANLRCGVAPVSTSATIVPAVVTTQDTPPPNQRETQLLELKNLLDAGLITQREYDQKQAAVLNAL